MLSGVCMRRISDKLQFVAISGESDSEPNDKLKFVGQERARFYNTNSRQREGFWGESARLVSEEQNVVKQSIEKTPLIKASGRFNRRQSVARPQVRAQQKESDDEEATLHNDRDDRSL